MTSFRKTTKTRAWFWPTSPRSPGVLELDFELVKKLDGVIWDKKSQTNFGMDWSKLSRDRNKPKDPAFTARDRVNRAPKVMGLVKVPSRGKSPIELTPAGDLFSSLSDKSSIYLKQLLKYQVPSPLHQETSYPGLNIRPFVAVVKIMSSVKYLTKEEFQLFVLTTTNADDISKTINLIEDFRQKLKSEPAGLKRKTFRKMFAEKVILGLYEEDLNEGNVELREGGRNFIGTKLSTLRDYADAFMRFMMVTNLFSLEPRTGAIRPSQFYLEQFEYINEHMSAVPIPTNGKTYGEWVDEYLGDPSLPELPGVSQANRRVKIITKLSHLTARSDSDEIIGQLNAAKDGNDLEKAIDKAIKQLGKLQRIEAASEIKAEKEIKWSEVKDLYEAIGRKDPELIDRPLLYEYNTWRAMEVLNDNIETYPHLKFDLDGQPNTTAPGKMADMEVEFDNFWLVVEVTLQTGMKQFEAEGESIYRHTGTFQKERLKQGDKRPVYGLFLAERINENVKNYLRGISVMPSKAYSGPVRIFPIERVEFVAMIELAMTSPSTANKLMMSLNQIFTDARDMALTEEDWFIQGSSRLKSQFIHS